MKIRISPRAGLVAAICLVLAAGHATRGQTPPPQPQPASQSEKKPAISVRSEVVLVPAVVTDHSGAHVSDLAQSDFTILENGQPQQIAFFHHIRANVTPAVRPSASSPSEPASSLQARSDRSAILVFDLLNSSITEQSNARDELMKFLSGSPALDQPVGLVALTSEGVTLLHDFTHDAAQLADALEKTKGQRSPKDTPETNPLESTFRGVQGWHSKSASRNAAAAQGRQTFLDYSLDSSSANLAVRTLITLEALREIGEAYSGIPGRKSLIWATGSVPFEMGDASHFRSYERALLPAYETAWRTLNRANIALYPLDVEDLINPGFVAPNTGQPLPQHITTNANTSNLESFAEATGGKLCDRQTSALSCFNTANDDSSDYYLIGFYQSAGNSNPGWRKLSVKVTRPGVIVRSRSGYYVRAPQDEAVTRKEDVELALASPLDFTAVHFIVILTTMKDASGTTKKSVGFNYVISPGVVTVHESDNNHVSLDFAALAETADGTPAGGYSQALEGHIHPEGITTLRTKGLSFPGSIDLPPGDYTVRFVVRDNISSQVGSTTTTLKVP
jgi:VWFA-related protein